MAKKIKIYTLATNYPKPTINAPKFAHLLNKELVKLGADVKVITPHSKNTLTKENMDSVLVKRFRYLPANYEIDKRSIPDEIRFSKFGKFKVAIMLLNFFIFTFFECLKEKPDILHGHWAFPGGYFANVISKFFGIKYVVSIHGGETPLLKKNNFIRRKTINSLNKASQIIVNSDYTKDEYVKMGLTSSKIIRINPIPNFVTHNSDADSLKEFRNKFATDDHKLILFAGRLTERKGVEYLIKSLPKIKNQKIHLIIAGGGWLLKELQELTSSLDLENKVTFFGSPTDKELGKLHDISDIFVVPSIIDSMGETEGLGLVIPEAMKSGLPVIASSVGGIVDVIENEVNGILVPQKNPEAIAKSVEKVITDKELREKIIENSKKTVKEFSPKTIAEKHFEIFTSLVKDRVH